MAIKTTVNTKARAQLVGDTPEKVPTGQCPLCFTDNSYMSSGCVECGLPLPWAKAAVTEREPSGQCIKCQNYNTYTALNCTDCGARLPWANAVSPTNNGMSNVGLGPAALPAPSVGYNYYAAAAGGNALPSPAGAMALNGTSAYTGSFGGGSGTTMITMDVPSQAIDIVSFLAPPLGFIAHVALLSSMPRVAISAGQKAFYGMFLWVPIGLWMVFGHHTPRVSVPTPAPAKAPVTAAADSAWSSNATSSSGAPAPPPGRAYAISPDDNS